MLTVVVLSEQLGPLPEIVPPLPPGSETIRMQELVSQPISASGKSNIIKKTFRDALIERRGEFPGRMEGPRSCDYARRNRGRQVDRGRRQAPIGRTAVAGDAMAMSFKVD